MSSIGQGMALDLLRDLGDSLTGWSQKWIPDGLVIVWLLTVISFGLTFVWGDATPTQAITAWGKGFWVLLEFAMEMCLILMTGYILACSKPIKRLLDALSGVPSCEKPWQAIAAMCIFSMLTGLVNWGLSLIGSAMFALYLIRRNPKTDYRLLVASAYLGLGCTWHAGLSASAPLLVNTPDNFLIQSMVLDAPISTSETVFTFFNLVLVTIVIVSVTTLMSVLHPSKEKTYKLSPELLGRVKLYEGPKRPARPLTPSEWLNWWPGLNVVVATAGLAWLGSEISTKGFAQTVNLNNINLFFLVLGVLFHWHPWAFLKAAEESVTAVWGIIIQFPFYAGIFGLFKFTALATVISKGFLEISSPSTFLLIVCWFSGLVNYLIPSGASEFVVLAPYIIPTAKELGVSVPKTVLAYAWGDMITDMIQPFWAIALLAVARLEFREIVGWLLLVFVTFFVITSIGFLILPFI